MLTWRQCCNVLKLHGLLRWRKYGLSSFGTFSRSSGLLDNDGCGTEVLYLLQRSLTVWSKRQEQATVLVSCRPVSALQDGKGAGQPAWGTPIRPSLTRWWSSEEHLSSLILQLSRTSTLVVLPKKALSFLRALVVLAFCLSHLLSLTMFSLSAAGLLPLLSLIPSARAFCGHRLPRHTLYRRQEGNASIPAEMEAEKPAFGYGIADGPLNWAHLSADFSLCATVGPIRDCMRCRFRADAPRPSNK